jgi:hypothetical protein
MRAKKPGPEFSVRWRAPAKAETETSATHVPRVCVCLKNQLENEIQFSMIHVRLPSLSMNPDDESKPEARAGDDDALLKALELELFQKRASWQKAHAQRNVWRSVSFLFLFIVVMAALFALYYVMTAVPRKTSEQTDPAPAATPAK